jgi:DNA-binding response OmpR family regulator
MQSLSTTTRPGQTYPYPTPIYHSTSVKDEAMSKILIVADDADHLQQVAEILTKSSYPTRTLQAGSEIFKTLPGFEPDILLVDRSTSGIENFMTLAFIRHLTDLAEMKVFVIVRDANQVKVAKSFWKADAVLVSPVSEEELLNAVTTYLDTNQQE